MYPLIFENLIEYFSKLPGVGRKTAERYAYKILELSEEDCEGFLKAISTCREHINTCKICHNMCDGEYCEICMDKNRDQDAICVVSSAKDVISMEKTNSYHGLYHVLEGLISTSKGIMPENINIQSLINRINENIKEVIIATDPTKDGEITALYIAKLLEDRKILVTRLAHGLPMGGLLDYADELTLKKAIDNRLTIDK